MAIGGLTRYFEGGPTRSQDLAFGFFVPQPLGRPFLYPSPLPQLSLTLSVAPVNTNEKVQMPSLLLWLFILMVLLPAVFLLLLIKLPKPVPARWEVRLFLLMGMPADQFLSYIIQVKEANMVAWLLQSLLQPW